MLPRGSLRLVAVFLVLLLALLLRIRIRAILTHRYCSHIVSAGPKASFIGWSQSS